MRFLPFALFLALVSANSLQAKVVVFSEPGFPTVGSEPISHATLASALGPDAVFATVSQLTQPETLRDANLLVLPYGSAFPAEAWPAIQHYLDSGGNLLVLGGQPFEVPVTGASGTLKQLAAQDTWARELDFRHSYAVPGMASVTFAWRTGYEFLPKVSIRARQFFAVEGELDGLGYMLDASGDKVAAPVIVADRARGASAGSRVVALDFDPEPGYWESADGVALLRAAAAYAEAGATRFWIEEQVCALRPGEAPLLTLHLRRSALESGGAGSSRAAEAHVEMLAGGRVLDSADVPLTGTEADAAIPFRKTLDPGFYTVRATLSFGGEAREFYANGFFVEDLAALNSGPSLGVNGNFLTRGGKPFFPVGTNYFSTESDGWDFSGPRNAQVWEDDFADMERHGVNSVRTGVWMSNAKFVEPETGGANERFLRNVEAFLAAAQRHHIAVNFNFFAFAPQSGANFYRSDADRAEAPPNPYLNPEMVRAEQAYVLSVVRRFARVPFLCWDLINEPSFSNPRSIFHGNVPNGDPSEVAAWQRWLREKYPTVDALAAAWRVPQDQLGNFDKVPLPQERDLHYERSGNRDEVRALDYNLFAQEMFSQWVHGMVEAIRGAGSTQLIDVGQDEGGVTDRVLNQFYATSGVSFTTNHTYWQDDALLWDSVAAKYPGVPNITGETGYQPVVAPDGTPRYDELTGTALEERKWALGFAAGSSGALQWDWDREGDFGIERSDGSAKIWESMMRDLGQFAEQAAPWATGVTLPRIAIVLPQSLQLSVYNSEALEAQQAAVRVLYHYDRAAAYAVGEYQIGTLGAPKLILLPSAYGLTDDAWKALEEHVRAGAVLLISGPFAGDAHLRATDRAADIGLGYTALPLELREQSFAWAGAPLRLTYGGMKTTTLSRAELPGGKDWVEQPLGKGRILFSALPLELNDRLDSVAQVYAYAMKAAGVEPVYTTSVTDPGILISPTTLPHATLYVLTSETNETAVSFRDQRSGKNFTGTLEPGRAALLLVGEDGTLLANYRWHGH